MKLRACQVYGFMMDLNYRRNNHLRIAVIGLHKCMFDKHMPVRFAAAITISKLAKAQPEVRQLLYPALSSFIETYLNLIDEIDSESLQQALESIMNTFKNSIKPFATRIVKRCVD
jgi:importin-7